MKKNRHISLMAEVLTGSIGIMVVITIFLFASMIFLTQKIISRSALNSIEQTTGQTHFKDVKNVYYLKNSNNIIIFSGGRK